MFWRLLIQLIRATRARVILALIALAGGAAVSSALLNLYFDAERKLTQEFRTLGANVVVAPPRAASDTEPPLADAAVMEKIAAARTPDVVAAAPYLYVVAKAGDRQQPVIVAGTWPSEARRMASWWELQGAWIEDSDPQRCIVGRNVARMFNLVVGDLLAVQQGAQRVQLTVAGIAATGGAEDSQVLVALPVAQRLAGLEGKIALIQMSVTGAPQRITVFANELSRALPGLEVRPIRQLAEAEGQLLHRIRLLVFAAVTLILALTALCVLAAMTAVAMEHRRDVGLMKAIGGEMSRVVRLFLAEAGLLGLAGGLLGWAGGLLLSEWIGRSVFGVAIAPRPEVLPLTVALMTAVALAGALPLRLLTHVRPAIILRGQ
jgi:putative ABC transport system permease protein